MNEFIDLCILCGCDYIPNIRGIGPKRAYEYILKYKSIDEMIKHLNKDNYKVPENFLYQEARQLFIKPDVVNVDDVKLEWKDADEEGVINYLVTEKNFSEERVKTGLKRLKDCKGKASQKRLDSFFQTAIPPSPFNKTNTLIGKKRTKMDDDNNNNGPKSKKQRTKK